MVWTDRRTVVVTMGETLLGNCMKKHRRRKLVRNEGNINLIVFSPFKVNTDLNKDISNY